MIKKVIVKKPNYHKCIIFPTEDGRILATDLDSYNSYKLDNGYLPEGYVDCTPPSGKWSDKRHDYYTTFNCDTFIIKDYRKIDNILNNHIRGGN